MERAFMEILCAGQIKERSERRERQFVYNSPPAIRNGEIQSAEN
jgi:hypothetical protein